MTAHTLAWVLAVANGVLVTLNFWLLLRVHALHRFYNHLVADWIVCNKAAADVIGQKNQP